MIQLTLVTHRGKQSLESYLDFVKSCLQGGVNAVQLRDKEASKQELLMFARRLKEVLHPFGALLLINDHIDIAIESQADGVHLGQEDGDVNEARRRLGPEKIIGLSIESFDDLERANRLSDIDYVGASAVFESRSKHNCKTIWGTLSLKQLVSKSKHPVIGIGGIDANNVQSVIQAGAAGVAVIEALHQPHPENCARQLQNRIQACLPQ